MNCRANSEQNRTCCIRLCWTRRELLSALRLYVEGLADRSGLRVELDIDPNLQRLRLMPRENSVRHSLGGANQYPLPCES